MSTRALRALGRNRNALRSRTIGLAVGVGAAFAFLGGYLFFLQVVRGLEFRTRAHDVSLRELPIPAQRGEIFDRTYTQPLVANRDAFAVDVIPGEVPDGAFAELFAALSEVLGVDAADLAARIPPSMQHLFQPIKVKSGVEFREIAYLAEHIDQYPGVTWHSEPVRDYQRIGSLAHVVGYVGDITREELQALFNEGYTPASTLGKSGVEKVYDRLLRGVDGKRLRTVDVRERAVSEIGQTVVPPEAGSDLVLTVDRRLQEVAEQALGNRVGSVVVLQPATGAVLAMVSYPTFDPGSFTGDEGAEAFRALALDPSFPFINRAIQSSYPPASTFKILMTTAVAEEGTLARDHTIQCNGTFEYGDRVFNDWIEEGHGPVDLDDALAHSCDIYFYQAGDALGIEAMVRYGREFGLGRASGIDLPGEADGFVPTPAWKEAVRNTPWVGGDTVNMSIGQGFITVTPLQLANMVAMVVNDGVIYRPHVVREVRDSTSGQLISATTPEPIQLSGISAETFAFVREAMRGVITDGTAEVVLTTKAVEVAGKTGTSEVGVEDRFHSWFAAYGPYQSEDPLEQIVVVVMVEAVNEWEWWAPKAANLIFQAAFAEQTLAEAVATLRPWYQSAIRVAD